MSRLHYEVYIGRDTPLEIPILYKGLAIDFVALGVTKASVIINSVEYDSVGGYVDYSSGVLVLKLGGIITPPTGKVSTRIIIYSPNYPSGYVIFSEKTENRITLEFV